MPFNENMILADLNVGVLFLIAIAGINTPAVFLAGWSSDNKYALLGAMRTIAMLISYEIVQVLALLGPVLFVGSMRLADIVSWQDDYNTWIFFIQPLGLLALHHRRCGRDEPLADGHRGGGVGDRRRVPHGVRRHQVRVLLPGGVHGGVRRRRRDRGAVHGRLDGVGAGGVRAGVGDLPGQALRRVLRIHLEPRARCRVCASTS